jgi:hypothetical protein
VCPLNQPVRAQGAGRRAPTRRDEGNPFGTQMSHDNGAECVGLGGPHLMPKALLVLLAIPSQITPVTTEQMLRGRPRSFNVRSRRGFRSSH